MASMKGTVHSERPVIMILCLVGSSLVASEMITWVGVVVTLLHLPGFPNGNTMQFLLAVGPFPALPFSFCNAFLDFCHVFSQVRLL